MRLYWTFNRTKAIVASLAGAAVFTGPVIADKSAFAENTDEVSAMDQGTYLIEPSETHPGYMLPPLSDHLIVAKLNEAQFAFQENEDQGAPVSGSGTAHPPCDHYLDDGERSCPISDSSASIRRSRSASTAATSAASMRCGMCWGQLASQATTLNRITCAARAL